MIPASNQHGRLKATSKTHEFNLLDEITVEILKLRLIISEVGTFTYYAAKVIVDYLKSLCQNKYKTRSRWPLSVCFLNLEFVPEKTKIKRKNLS